MGPLDDSTPFFSVAHYGSEDVVHKSVFPDPEAPVLIAGALHRLWAAALEEGINPLNNLGNRAAKEVKSQHTPSAIKHLGYTGTGMFPCGAVHGGYSIMAGIGHDQKWTFKYKGKEYMAPFEWKLHRAIRHHDPYLHTVLLRLMFSMEHLVLRSSPKLWLKCHGLWGDLQREEPKFGRLFGWGFNNQFVVNRNLLLTWHDDYRNHPEVCLPFTTLPTPSLFLLFLFD